MKSINGVFCCAELYAAVFVISQPCIRGPGCLYVCDEQSSWFSPVHMCPVVFSALRERVDHSEPEVPQLLWAKKRERAWKRASKRGRLGYSVLQSVWGCQLCYHCWRWTSFSSPSFCCWSSQALSSVFLPQVGHMCAQLPVQGELIQRCQQLQSRLSTLKIENEEVTYTCVHIHSLCLYYICQTWNFFVSKHWVKAFLIQLSSLHTIVGFHRLPFKLFTFL